LGEVPSVSVLVTTFNHADFVEEALDSLRDQTTDDFEVIITDDASTDGTAEVIEAWLARTGFDASFIRNDHNRGICANRNTALMRARGEFVCSLSGDDACQPDRIERQLARFRREPDNVAAVCSDMIEVDVDGRETRQRRVLDPASEGLPEDGATLASHLLLHGNFLLAPAVMVRRSSLDAVGPYNEDLLAEDFQMWLRLSSRFAFVHLPEALVRYRHLDTSLSHSSATTDRRKAEQLGVLTEWLGRTNSTETDAALARRLWFLATDMSRNGHRDQVTATMRASAEFSGRLDHRLIVLAIGSRPGWWLLTVWARARRRVKSKLGRSLR
jgi:glycosyltransferase involved in cell wall biosynthesis